MPNTNITNDASKGLVTARDASTLRPGELAEAIAGEYRVGSPHWYKQLGRKSRDTLGSSVEAINLFQYDSASDVLIAIAGGTLYSSAATTSPSFSASSLTGLTTPSLYSFTGFQDRWFIANGVDEVKLRESDGTLRGAGMKTTATAATVTAITGTSTAVRPGSDTGDYSNGSNARDSDDTTYAMLNVNGGATKTHTWTFTSDLASATRILSIHHKLTGSSGATHGPTNPKFDTSDGVGGTDPSDVSALIEWSEDGGTTWTTLSTHSSFDGTESHSIAAGDITNQLKVRVTVTETVGNATHKIYDIKVTAGGSVSTATTNPVYYAYTEVYVDSNLVVHEGNMGASVATDGVLPVGSGYFGVKVDLPAKRTAHATNYYIYRSVDTPGGGFPNFYHIDTIPAAAATWIDDFTLPLTSDNGKDIYTSLTVLYSSGESLVFSALGPPPTSSVVLSFQGSVVYVPTDPALSRRVYYSLPSTITPAACEQVPDPYYLDFQTQKNDTVISAATTNGGQSLLVFFQNYTMLVTYLPQATDGSFDNRVKQYVSNNRGTSGPLTCCEFTLPTGQTLVASVDSLGMWITNGVNLMEEWSRDLKWEVDLDGVDLTKARLIDNTAKRRLELLFVKDGANKEYHFFYGRLKEDGDGKSGPLITGPHPSGVACKHYCILSGSWEGFSGGASSTGGIFHEEDGVVDEAHGYDSTGIIPWSWQFGDVYVGGLTSAHIVETAQCKFVDGTNKQFTMIGTFMRDIGNTTSRTKTFNSNAVPNLCYFHVWCDRNHMRITDITNTAAPVFVGIEVDARAGGISRDR